MEQHRDQCRRLHERFRLGGIARLVIDHPAGLVTVTGRLVDLSEGGCQLRLFHHVDPYLPARVRIDMAGHTVWMPVVTQWIRQDAEGWTVGCTFDRPTAEKAIALRTLLGTQPRLSA